jgi:hypothetical protein
MGRAKDWQLHEAKARELFRRVREAGEDRAGELGRQPESLLEFFQAAPGGHTLDLRRKRDTTRTIKW